MRPAVVQLPRHPLGSTGLEVTPLCFGGGPLGSMPEAFGYEVAEERAVATVHRILRGPVTFLDTAASYGDGRSEARIGRALREAGGPPEGFVLATKVDRDLTTGEFTGAQMRRSLERSLTLLGLDRVPLVYLHDPEHLSFEEGTAPGGPLDELMRMRDEGLTDHVGLAGGPVDLMRRYLATEAFEVLITHNRWTLVDRSADALLDDAAARGVAVVNAAVLGGGLLARGVAASSRYAYAEADPRLLQRVVQLEGACALAGVPLGAAALQFSMRDPRVTSSILGVTSPEHVDEAIRWATTTIPDALWEALLPLAAPPDLWLN